MLRKLFYLLPPSWRHSIRWIIYLPKDLFSAKKELTPPARLIYTGRGDFITQGKEWCDFFIHHAGLTPTDKVLDIGSGIGRIALPLKEYLTVKYEGFDAVKLGVEWCTQNISKRYPHFRFQYFPLHNDLYNQSALKASHFQFPYPENEFDFACAISVFTHMLPDEVENYISQMKRVLNAGAIAVCTFFVLTDDSIKYMNSGSGTFKFKITGNDPFALMDEKVKSANVAYYVVYLENIVYKSFIRNHQQNTGTLVWQREKYEFRIPGYMGGKEKVIS